MFIENVNWLIFFDIFQGDSGGPLLCNGKLTGIVSYGPSEECGHANMVGVYTNLSAYASVIKKYRDFKF